MSELVEVGNHPEVQLFRYGKASAPLDLPSPEFLKKPAFYRFDDPKRRIRVLYAAENPLSALLEGFASLRKSSSVLAKLQAISGDDPLPVMGAVTQADLQTRKLAVFRILPKPAMRFLDLRELSTRTQLTAEMAATLADMGVEHLESAEVLGTNRPLTQAIGGWAYEAGYNGIVYLSRYDPRLTNWALFEPVMIEPISEMDIVPGNPVLDAVLKLHKLRLLP